MSFNLVVVDIKEFAKKERDIFLNGIITRVRQTNWNEGRILISIIPLRKDSIFL